MNHRTAVAVASSVDEEDTAANKADLAPARGFRRADDRAASASEATDTEEEALPARLTSTLSVHYSPVHPAL